jgi:hypothetical protein
LRREKKIYDFNIRSVQSRLVSALKRGTDGATRGSTLADLIAATGLPRYQAEQGIKHVCNEYRGHLKVTESGEILYYFPHGMRSTVRGFVPRAKRFLRRLLTATAKVLSFLFKVWIMIMLVGYFLLFLALLLVALIASVVVVVGRGGRDSRSRGGGVFSFYFVVRILELFLWIWLYSGAGSYRKPRNRGRPLHRSVFAYVFGDRDPADEWEESQKKYLIHSIRSMKGVVTLEELMVLTGLNPLDAQRYMNRLLLEQEGEPSVTDEGTLIYLFPSLLRSGRESIEAAGKSPLMNPQRRMPVPFNSNEAKTNRWITFFNGFNVLFSSYFLYFAVTNPQPVMEIVRGVQRLHVDFVYLYHFLTGLLSSLNIEPAVMIIFIALGIVPLAFSVFFFLIPSALKSRNEKNNDTIRRENIRKSVYFHVLSNPDGVEAREIRSTQAEDSLERSGSRDQLVADILDELAAFKAGLIEEKEDGTYIYRFPDLERELKDVEVYRRSLDLKQFELGETVFDSGEDE